MLKLNVKNRIESLVLFMTNFLEIGPDVNVVYSTYGNSITYDLYKMTWVIMKGLKHLLSW